MTDPEAVAILFDEAMSKPYPRNEAYYVSTWLPVPLEWNSAMRFADLTGRRVRMIAKDGSINREYIPQVSR